MALGGPISVALSFSVDVKDTDFFATLIDIDPKGVARIIGQPGKIDLKYRNGNDKPELLEPGKTYTVRLDLWDTAHQFAKGHQVGLFIRSELFPAYARNLNTGEPIKEATKSVVAHITILHDAAHPSVLKFRVLPVK
jgi:putative CocE/NonD family hydrolase